MEHRDLDSVVGLPVIEQGYRIGMITKVCLDEETFDVSLHVRTEDGIECVVPASLVSGFGDDYVILNAISKESVAVLT